MKNKFLILLIIVSVVFSVKSSFAQNALNLNASNVTSGSREPIRPKGFSTDIEINFVDKGLEKLIDLPQFAQSGILEKLRSISLKYASQRKNILLGGGLSLEQIRMIMEKSAPWYGDSLLALFRGEESRVVSQEYIHKVQGLFESINLDVSLRRKIENLIEEHFREVENLLQLLHIQK